VPSDNIPSKPIFRHNATAVYSIDVRNAFAAFRTPLALFSNIKGQASLSTLQKYPFDEYTAQIFLFAQDSESKELVGLQIGEAHGIAVGFQAVAQRTPIPGRIYSGVISEAITISRSRLLKAYVLVIVIAVWLLTLMFLFVMVCILCGYGFDVSLLLVPVATLFAITQLRASMPGAPPGFGAIVDFVGILPCLALTSISASLTIAALVFSTPTEVRYPIWKHIPVLNKGSNGMKEQNKNEREAKKEA